MNNYCTLFDSNYLTRGLAMYESLCKTDEKFNLYIFCFDDLSYELLNKLNLKHIILITLSELEDDRLLSVKDERTKAEYCWTCSSFIIRYCLDHFCLPEVTYIDADLYFFNKPEILLDEFHASGKSVMITEHRYSPEYDQSEASGIYCVQFMTFKSDINGMEVLQWWQDKCIEWCFNRIEDGRFGDQKYLDNWPQMFKGVYVLQHLGGGVAPWNVQQYKITAGPKVNNCPVVFYHYHGLKWMKRYTFNLYTCTYKLTLTVIKHIYASYVKALIRSLLLVRIIDKSFSKGIESEKMTLKDRIILFKLILKGNCKIIKYICPKVRII